MNSRPYYLLLLALAIGGCTQRWLNTEANEAEASREAVRTSQWITQLSGNEAIISVHAERGSEPEVEPGQVQSPIKDRRICTATLIAANIALTSARCVYRFRERLDDLFVKLASTETVGVEKIEFHEKFKAGVESSTQRIDAAALILKGEASSVGTLSVIEHTFPTTKGLSKDSELRNVSLRTVELASTADEEPQRVQYDLLIRAVHNVRVRRESIADNGLASVGRSRKEPAQQNAAGNAAIRIGTAATRIVRRVDIGAPLVNENDEIIGILSKVNKDAVAVYSGSAIRAFVNEILEKYPSAE